LCDIGGLSLYHPLEVLAHKKGWFLRIYLFFALQSIDKIATPSFSINYSIISNHSTKEIQAEAIRVLAGKLPMLNTTDLSNRTNIMVIIVFVVHYIKSQAS
jgi:hypothetical protein